MRKKPFKLRAYIKNIGEIQKFDRGEGIPPVEKINIDLETKDEQLLFAELRRANFEKAKYLRSGMCVDIEYVFAGSEKAGLKYNNLIILQIETMK